LPSGSWKVWANAWDGTQTDITGACTITGGTSVLIPSAIVASYAYGGLATFDVGQTAGAVIRTIGSGLINSGLTSEGLVL
jgi:hypothetical protein